MKCPFVVRIVKRIEPQFDEAGNKIGEDIVEEVERADCLKGDCIIFSTDKNQCSFVSIHETSSALDGLAARSVDNILNRYEGIIKEKIDTIKTEVVGTITTLIEDFRKADERIYNLQKTGFEKLLSFVSGGYETSKLLGPQINEIKSAFEELGREQTKTLEGLTQKFDDSIKEIGAKLSSNFQELMNREQQGREEFSGKIGSLTERMTQDLNTGFEGVKNKVGEEIGRLVESGTQAQEKADRSFADLIQGINNLSGQIGQDLGGRLEELKNKISEEFGKMIESSGQSQERMTKGLEDMVQGMSNLSGQISQELGGSLNEMRTTISNEFSRFLESEAQMREKMIIALDDVGVKIVGMKDEFNQYLKQQEERFNQLVASEKSYREDSVQKLDTIFGGFKEGMENAINGMKSEVSNQIEKIGEFGKNYQVWIDSAVQGFRETVEFAVSNMKSEVAGQIDKIGEFEKSHQIWMEEVIKEIRGFFESEQAFLKEERERRRLEEADRLNEMAILDYHRGNYESALTSVKQALELNEKSEFYANLGMIHTELNNADDAKKAFERALELNPNSAEVYNNLGVLNYRIKDFDQAVNAFNEAIKRRSNYTIAYLHLGKALLDLEKYDDAIKTWEKILEIDPENTEAKDLIRMYKEGSIDGHTEET